jgi:PPK2 family polyphosphate:nucleotide phosphotransferase
MSNKHVKLIEDKNITINSGKDFELHKLKTNYTAGLEKEATKAIMEEHKAEIAKLQDVLYASDKHAVLMIFQAMDAAGKDGTIRHVMSGVNPQGCQVVSFKKPTELELSHDFMWRTTVALPERGRIGIFNRSYYEEVIVTKVHPEFILYQNIPHIKNVEDIDKKFWKQRYEYIRNFEKHLAENGTVILKFFLNVSKEEQKQRFLERIEDPTKNWKFNPGDIEERQYWDDYQQAYQEAIEETATEYAPWFVIPADRNWFMRYAVAEILRETLEDLGLKYPELNPDYRAKLTWAKQMLMKE